jgi:hypothetical protein
MYDVYLNVIPAVHPSESIAGYELDEAVGKQAT